MTMAFIEQLGTALKDALTDEETLTEGLGDILKQSIGGFMTDGPAEQIGAQGKILEERQAKEAAAAKAAEIRREQAEFVQKENLKSRNKRALEADKYYAKQIADNAKVERNMVIRALEEAGKTNKPYDKELKALVNQSGIPEEVAKSLIEAYRPENKDLTDFMKVYKDYETLKSKDPKTYGDTPGKTSFEDLYATIHGTVLQQNYAAYVKNVKAINEKKKAKGAKESPIMSFYDYGIQTAGRSKSTGTDKDNDAVGKAARKFMEDVRHGKIHPDNFVESYDPTKFGSPNRTFKPSLMLTQNYNVSGLSAIIPLNSRVLHGFVKTWEQKNKGTPEPAEKVSKMSNAVSGRILSHAESMNFFRVPPSVDNKVKPENFNPKDKNYNPEMGKRYLTEVQGVLKKLATLPANNRKPEVLREKFGISVNELQGFQESYKNIQQEVGANNSFDFINDKSFKEFGDVVKKILKYTKDHSLVENILSHAIRPTVKPIGATDVVGAAQDLITYDPRILKTFAPLLASTNLKPLQLQNIIDRVQSDQQGVIFQTRDEKGQISDVTITGSFAGAAPSTLQAVAAFSNAINNKDIKVKFDDEAYAAKQNRDTTFDVYGTKSMARNEYSPKALYKDIYNYSKTKDRSIFEDDESFQEAKFALVSAIAPRSAVRGDRKNLHLGAVLLDAYLRSGQKFNRGDAGIIEATPTNIAGLLNEEVTTVTGRKVAASTGDQRKIVKDTVESTTILKKGIVKVNSILAAVDQLLGTVTRMDSKTGMPVQVKISEVERINVEDLAQLDKQPLTGITGAIATIMTGVKLTAGELTNYLRPAIQDRTSARLAKGFAAHITPSTNMSTVASNQTFIMSGLSDAITTQSNALNAEYDDMLKNQDKLTQEQLDSYVLRRRILWEKISLTYMLAGFVQGDQAGGRTISNEDFANVREALWGKSSLETNVLFANQVKYVRETLLSAFEKQNAYAMKLSLEGLSETNTSSIMTKIDEQERKRLSSVAPQLKLIGSPVSRNEKAIRSLSFREVAESKTLLPLPRGVTQTIGAYDLNSYEHLAKMYEQHLKSEESIIGPPEITEDILKEIQVAAHFVKDYVENFSDIVGDSGEIPEVYLESFRKLDLTGMLASQSNQTLMPTTSDGAMVLHTLFFHKSSAGKYVDLMRDGAPLSWMHEAAQTASFVTNAAKNFQGDNTNKYYVRMEDLRIEAYK